MRERGPIAAIRPKHCKEHAIIRARHAVLTLTCAVTLAGGVTACGTAEQLSAANKVSTAFDKLGEGKSLSVTFSLDATPAQLLAADALDTSGGDKLTPAQAKQVSGLGATLTMSSDKPIKDVLNQAQAQSSSGRLDPALDFALEVHAGDDKPLIELRAVSGKEYLRVDVDGIVKLGGDSKAASEINGMHQAFADLPPSFAPLKSALDGKWISIDPKKLADFSKTLQEKAGTASATPSAVPTLDGATQDKLVKALTGVFTQDVTLTDKGTVNNQDHIVVEAPAQKLIADIQQAIAPIAKDIPALGSSFPTAAPTGVPAGNASADLLIDKDGSLSKLSIDLGQLDTPSSKGRAQLPASLTFDNKAAATTAPAGAVAFDPSVLQDLIKNFADAPGTTPDSIDG